MITDQNVGHYFKESPMNQSKLTFKFTKKQKNLHVKLRNKKKYTKHFLLRNRNAKEVNFVDESYLRIAYPLGLRTCYKILCGFVV